MPSAPERPAQATARAALRGVVTRLGMGSVLVGSLVAAHLLFGLARLPSGAVWKRLSSMTAVPVLYSAPPVQNA